MKHNTFYHASMAIMSFIIRVRIFMTEDWFRPGICVKYFLLFPQKKCHQRKLRVTKRLLFNFSMIKVTVIPKNAIWHMEIWQNWCFGWFYHSKIKKYTLSLSQFSLVTGYLRKREKNILHIFRTIILNL